MTTFSQLVDEVKTRLTGYTMRQDRITYLNNVGGINASAVGITIGSADNLAKGIIEIDDELIWVDSFDKASLTLSVIPGFGRGYLGTTAATHAQYAPIILTPTFPRGTIKSAINDTIQSLYPKLYVVKSTTLTFSAAVSAYVLPAEVQDVISVSWQDTGPSKEWRRCRRFRVDSMANVTAFGAANTISIYDAIPSGRTIQVTYTSLPQPLVANADEFTTVSGLPASCKDIVVLGACARLLAFIDSGRLNFGSVEADAADTKMPYSAGTSAAKFVWALFQQRLAEEASKMQGQYPFSPHYIS